MFADSRKAVGTNIFELFKKSGNKMNMKPQVLVFVLQQKSSQPYNEIKSYCDTQIGVASQCEFLSVSNYISTNSRAI